MAIYELAAGSREASRLASRHPSLHASQLIYKIFRREKKGAALFAIMLKEAKFFGPLLIVPGFAAATIFART